MGTVPTLTHHATGTTRSRGSRHSSGLWPSRRAVYCLTLGHSTRRSERGRTAPAPRAPAMPLRLSRGLLVRAVDRSRRGIVPVSPGQEIGLVDVASLCERLSA